jgi:hypothetical protein
MKFTGLGAPGPFYTLPRKSGRQRSLPARTRSITSAEVSGTR